MTLRYSFDALEAFLADPTRNVASLRKVINRDANQIARWRERGVRSLTADHLAISFGVHPSEIWPSWFDDADLEHCCPWCGTMMMSIVEQVYCSDECRILTRSERERDARRLAGWEQRIDRYRGQIPLLEVAA